MMAKFII